MSIPLDDFHLVSLLGICMVAVVVTAIAAASIRQWVREHEPNLALRFAFAPRRLFLSLQSGADRDLGDEQLFRWLRGGGATELIEKHPGFSALWKWYRRSKLASSVLICLWLTAIFLRLAQGSLYAS